MTPDAALQQDEDVRLREELEKIKEEISAEHMRAISCELDRAPYEKVQPLYARLNAMGVDPLTPIYRIMSLSNFCEDITNGGMTFVNVGPEIWGDELENPVRSLKFPDQATGGDICIEQLMRTYYATCWSAHEHESLYAWNQFGRASTRIRIGTTLGKLLHALMSQSDHFYFLRYFAGKVQYRTVSDIIKWRNSVPLDDLLDNQGLALAASLMVLKDDLQQEEEMRIVYSHLANDTWTKKNVVITKHPQAANGLARVPINWSEVLTDITVKSTFPMNSAQALQQVLTQNQLTCPIKTSSLV